ncbi:hypothetical protein [Croceicoccus naphthovorans]|uniref:Uncharacterized protein n=1 Tax=Croceicoccus naphthovorans TaxID=1348774 RepID=A0A0G3XF18_9SPHN|nr:hypothetical protein [Croceicoccus naphthovorans]AKM09797.1 hypothetical protein AB433_07080 [Croceicoccus naphthovorans]MBB3990644.1 hypothetical protein [Croceicoccus naphthovorans]
MTDTIAAPAGAGTRTRAEQLLARYPDLAETELAELLALFRKKLTAMDQAMIASEEHLARQYTAFKRDHINRFNLHDLRNAGLFVLIVVGPIVAIAFYYAG